MGAVKHIALTGPIWNNSSNKVFSFCVFLVQVTSSLWMMLAYVGEPLFEPQEGRLGLFSRDLVGPGLRGADRDDMKQRSGLQMVPGLT